MFALFGGDTKRGQGKFVSYFSCIANGKIIAVLFNKNVTFAGPPFGGTKEEVNGYEPTPATSLSFVKKFNIPTSAKIIDIRGGDSLFVDYLLDLGYQDITVLDISAAALARAKKRLGENAHKVKWIVADAADFTPTEKYDFWHDRAAFHFLTQENEIVNYIKTIQKNLQATGILVVGTFSEQGPQKCSGIEIKQYSEISLAMQLQSFFEKIQCITIDHQSPFNTLQNFVFCSFKKWQAA